METNIDAKTDIFVQWPRHRNQVTLGYQNCEGRDALELPTVSIL